MKRALMMSFVVLISLLPTAAGIRGPGPYCGVVVFDRWDGCYMHSGPYLMYVSEKTKKRLRKYRECSMNIYAKEVDQPINPGDGRIGKYRVLGPATTLRPDIKVDGVKLKVTPDFTGDDQATFQIRDHQRNRKEHKNTERRARTHVAQKEGRRR